MTVNTTTVEISYTGDGVQVDFPFGFHTQLSTDIEVYADGQELLVGVVVTLNADQEISPGGNVNITPAPGSGVNIRILRNTPPTQQVDYDQYGPFPSQTHENALDKLTLLTQENRARIGQSIAGFAYQQQIPSSATGSTTWGDIESIVYTKQRDDTSLLLFIQASMQEESGEQSFVLGYIGATVDGAGDVELASAGINGWNGVSWNGRLNSLAAMKLIPNIASGDRTIAVRGRCLAGSFAIAQSQIFVMEI